MLREISNTPPFQNEAVLFIAKKLTHFIQISYISYPDKYPASSAILFYKMISPLINNENSIKFYRKKAAPFLALLLSITNSF